MVASLVRKRPARPSRRPPSRPSDQSTSRLRAPPRSATDRNRPSRSIPPPSSTVPRSQRIPHPRDDFITARSGRGGDGASHGGERRRVVEDEPAALDLDAEAAPPGRRGRRSPPRRPSWRTARVKHRHADGGVTDGERRDSGHMRSSVPPAATMARTASSSERRLLRALANLRDRRPCRRARRPNRCAPRCACDRARGRRSPAGLAAARRRDRATPSRRSGRRPARARSARDTWPCPRRSTAAAATPSETPGASSRAPAPSCASSISGDARRRRRASASRRRRRAYGRADRRRRSGSSSDEQPRHREAMEVARDDLGGARQRLDMRRCASARPDAGSNASSSSAPPACIALDGEGPNAEYGESSSSRDVGAELITRRRDARRWRRRGRAASTPEAIVAPRSDVQRMEQPRRRRRLHRGAEPRSPVSDCKASAARASSKR